MFGCSIYVSLIPSDIHVQGMEPPEMSQGSVGSGSSSAVAIEEERQQRPPLQPSPPPPPGRRGGRQRTMAAAEEEAEEEEEDGMSLEDRLIESLAAEVVSDDEIRGVIVEGDSCTAPPC